MPQHWQKNSRDRFNIPTCRGDISYHPLPSTRPIRYPRPAARMPRRDLPPVIYGGTEGGKVSAYKTRAPRHLAAQLWSPFIPPLMLHSPQAQLNNRISHASVIVSADAPMSEKSFPSDTHDRTGSVSFARPTRVNAGKASRRPCAFTVRGSQNPRTCFRVPLPKRDHVSAPRPCSLDATVAKRPILR